MPKRRCSVAGCKGYSKRTVFKFPNRKEEGVQRFNLWLERLKAHQHSAWKPDERIDGICDAHFDPSLIATIDPLSTDTAAKCASKNLGFFNRNQFSPCFFHIFLFTYLQAIRRRRRYKVFKLSYFGGFEEKSALTDGFSGSKCCCFYFRFFSPTFAKVKAI